MNWNSFSARPEHELHVVARGEDEGALVSRRIEARRFERCLERGQAPPDRGAELERARRGGEPVPLPAEERVVEERAQLREAVAHRGLRDADARGGSGHAALFEEGIERDEEIQVDRVKIHAVNILRPRYQVLRAFK
jgi:hypothetical protein